MKKTVFALLVVGLVTTAAQAAVVTYNFNEAVPGSCEWTVSVLIEPDAGDTDGLSTYAFRVYVPNAAQVTYDEVPLQTFSGAGFVGMNNPTNLVVDNPDDPKGLFRSIGNYQSLNFITGIGVMPVYVSSLVPNIYPDVILGVPAVLGTLTVPGLTYGTYDFSNAAFVADTTAVLNAARDSDPQTPDDFLGEVTMSYPTCGITVTPEPMTMSLVGLGGLALIRRRR